MLMFLYMCGMMAIRIIGLKNLHVIVYIVNGQRVFVVAVAVVITIASSSLE